MTFGPHLVGYRRRNVSADKEVTVVNLTRLTRRDGLATLVVTAAAALYWAYWVGADLPLVSGSRVLSVVVFVLGVTACAVGGNAIVPGESEPRRWAQVYGIHGVIAFMLAILVLITGSSALLAALVALVVLLWLTATVRHVVVAPTVVRRQPTATRT